MDKLGNISVYVPYRRKDDYTGFCVPAGGCWSLDGEASLRWVRSRYLQYYDERTGQFVYANQVAPDLSRIGRQQEFMRRLAGLAVVKSLDSPFTANLVADEIIKNLKVDDSFDTGSVFDLIDAFRTLNPDDTTALQFETVPGHAGEAADRSRPARRPDPAARRRRAAHRAPQHVRPAAAAHAGAVDDPHPPRERHAAAKISRWR